MMKNILGILVLFTAVYANAQTSNTDTVQVTTHRVFALSERTDASVNLRWAPSTPTLWLKGVNNGYNIYRMPYDSTKVLDKDDMKVIKTIKPKPKNEWLAEMKTMNDIPKFLAGAYECTFGEFKSLKLNKGMAGWLEQSDELNNKFSVALYIADINQQAAEYSGLFFEDTTVKEGISYVYLVEPITKGEDDFVYSSGVAISAKENTSYLPVELGVQDLDGSIKLYWPRNVDVNKKYTAFHVERNTKGNAFEQITEVPYIHGTSRDSTFYNPYNVYLDSIDNYTAAKYRVRGITPFGKLGPYSNVVSGEAKDLTPPTPPDLIETTLLEEGKMLVSWNISKEEDVAGYHIYRGNSPDNIQLRLNKKLLPKSTLKFLDTMAISVLENYYVVAIEDKKGNIARSQPEFAMIIDSVPPARPTGLKGEIDTTGVLTLQWNKNKEIDIRGYKVYFANDSSHEYALLTGEAVRDTVFQTEITLNTLTEEAWFKVMAVDKRYNYSQLSDSLKVMRPDTIAPNSPIFKEYKVLKKSIYLAWANSSSKDVVNHQLWRKQGQLNEWVLLSSFTNKETEYIDEDLVGGKQYIYKIVAIDDANLESANANELYLEAPKLYLKDVITTFNVIVKDGKSLLTWSLRSDEPCDIVVYKDVNNGGFYPLKTLGSDTGQFMDNANGTSEVEYAIKVKFKDGTFSPFSQVRKVNLND